MPAKPAHLRAGPGGGQFTYADRLAGTFALRERLLSVLRTFDGCVAAEGCGGGPAYRPS